MNTSSAAPRPTASIDDVPPTEAIRRCLDALSIGMPETGDAPRIDTALLCKQIGLWPTPVDYPQQLKALLQIAPALLQLYDSATVGGSRPMFDRWKSAVARHDHPAAAYWLMQLKLWPASRQDLAVPLATNGAQLRPIRPTNPKALSVVTNNTRKTPLASASKDSIESR